MIYFLPYYNLCTSIVTLSYTFCVDAFCFHVDNLFSEDAARTIQAHIRGLVARCKFLKMVDAVTLLQTVFRARKKVRQEPVCMLFTAGPICDFSCGISLLFNLMNILALCFITYWHIFISHRNIEAI